MTDTAELVKRARRQAAASREHGVGAPPTFVDEMADRLEALQAEVERHRALLQKWMDKHFNAREVEPLYGETWQLLNHTQAERLSTPSPAVTEEELAWVIYECDGLDGSWGYAPDDAKERSRYEARTVFAYQSVRAGGVTVEVEREACAKTADNVAAAARRWRSNIGDYNSHEATAACTQRDIAEGLAAAIRYRASAPSPVASPIACGEEGADVVRALLRAIRASQEQSNGMGMIDETVWARAKAFVYAAPPRDGSAALRAQEKEVETLREFARDIIADYCWGYSREPDGGDVQELAEKLGLIEPHIATAEDAKGQAEFDPGDTIYRFADWLDASRDCAIAEPSGEGVNSNNPTVISPIGKADEGVGNDTDVR